MWNEIGRTVRVAIKSTPATARLCVLIVVAASTGLMLAAAYTP